MTCPPISPALATYNWTILMMYTVKQRSKQQQIRFQNIDSMYLTRQNDISMKVAVEPRKHVECAKSLANADHLMRFSWPLTRMRTIACEE